MKWVYVFAVLNACGVVVYALGGEYSWVGWLISALLVFGLLHAYKLDKMHRDAESRYEEVDDFSVYKWFLSFLALSVVAGVASSKIYGSLRGELVLAIAVASAVGFVASALLGGEIVDEIVLERQKRQLSKLNQPTTK